MEKHYILVLDVGTSSLKAALFDRNFTIVTQKKMEYSYEAKGLNVQIHPEKIWQALLCVLKELKSSEYLNRVDLIVPCVFSPALIAMDREGNPLFPAIIHWDRRSAKQARKAVRMIGKERFLKITGNIPYPGGISLTSILWLQENEPEVFQKTHIFGHMNTFLLKRLTNNWTIDPTNASITGLYNTVTRLDWCEEITREFGIPTTKLPPVIPSLEIAGKITPEASKLTGVTSGVPVLMGSNDTSATALGAGLLENGQVLNISGSSEIITICLDKPIPDERYYLRTHPFPGLWLMYDIVVGGFAFEWFRTQFCREMQQEEFYGTYLKKVLEGEEQCRVKFVPYLAGDRTSLKQKKAIFSQLTLDTTREECLQALVKGITGRMQKTLTMMAKRTKLQPKMVLTGGASSALVEYKRKIFAGFQIEPVENCSLWGCLEMAKRAGIIDRAR
ncbi:MAG: FGGY-family carbohydrate kinase [Candidatus Caldatribacteriaceae bacterium]